MHDVKFKQAANTKYQVAAYFNYEERFWDIFSIIIFNFLAAVINCVVEECGNELVFRIISF